MSKFELSLAENYVASWGVSEGVREIFQNAIDQETQDETNTMFYKYDNALMQLSIGNKKSVLSTSTLLLGCTTKADAKDQIGQFGEGYKIATLALLRSGHNVTFYNYGAKEIWRPRFVDSKRYGAKVLTFFTEKHIWSKVPDNDLTIVIDGISGSIWAQICTSNLHVRTDVGKVYETPFGRILTEDAPGNVYVNGLFVKQLDDLLYAYDIKPEYLSLDRDRRMVQTYNVTWITAKMLAATDNPKLIKAALDSKYKDAEDLHYHLSNVSAATHTAISDSFVNTHGTFAVPVSSQSDLNRVQAEYSNAKPVMVTESEKNLIIGSTNWHVQADRATADTIRKRLELWFAIWNPALPGNACKTLQAIINDLPEDDDLPEAEEEDNDEEAEREIRFERPDCVENNGLAPESQSTKEEGE